MSELDLTFPSYPIGTHQVPWDLKILLFKGASNIPRKSAIVSIEGNKFGKRIEERTPLVVAFHEAICSMISLGKSRALVESSLEVLWRFFAWSDKNSQQISPENVIEIFKLMTSLNCPRIISVKIAKRGIPDTKKG